VDYITFAGGFSSAFVHEGNVYLGDADGGLYRWADSRLDGTNMGNATTYAVHYTSSSNPAIRTNYVNDVSVATIAGKRYVAVALGNTGAGTSSGVTLINEADGTSVHLLNDSYYGYSVPVTRVSLTTEGRLYALQENYWGISHLTWVEAKSTPHIGADESLYPAYRGCRELTHAMWEILEYYPSTDF
jgi:hypothetical protein